MYLPGFAMSDLDSLWNTVPLLSDKLYRHLYGDFNEHFALFARVTSTSYVLAYEDLLSSTFYFARLVDEPSLIRLYAEKGLDNAPRPLEYPADIVLAYSKKTAAFCRPVPVSMAINHWADRIYKLNAKNNGRSGVNHALVAAIMVTLLMNRAPAVVAHARARGLTPREFFNAKLKHLKFCLEQSREVEQFGV